MLASSMVHTLVMQSVASHERHRHMLASKLMVLLWPTLRPVPHYIISNTFHWTRAIGIGAYPTVPYFLSYILVA